MEMSEMRQRIRIPYDQPLPEDLIRSIAEWCFEKYSR